MRQAEARDAPRTAKPATPPPTIKRPPMYFVSDERKRPRRRPGYLCPRRRRDHTFPCVLENILNSEIEGNFTVKTTRAGVGRHRAASAHSPGASHRRQGRLGRSLLFGNERIPTLRPECRLPDGRSVRLGQAPIMDAAGTNGLTGEVDNHVWR